MKIAVGCPVKNRAWILHCWFEYLDEAFAEIGVEPKFFLLCGTSTDGTLPLLGELIQGRDAFIASTTEPQLLGDRVWNKQRYSELAQLRNELLREIRDYAPDYYLSIDSDILIAPGVLPNLISDMDQFDAVAGKVYLSPPPFTSVPNYAKWGSSGSMQRYGETVGPCPVDVIMALKLMSPAAYNVNYAGSDHGEDIGWSRRAQAAGLKLGFDGRIISKHVMKPDFLGEIDQRVGY